MPLFLSLIFVRLNDTTPVSFTLTSEGAEVLRKKCLRCGGGFGIICAFSLLVGYQSGQLGRTVNPLALPSYVRIVDPPPF